MVGTSRGPLWTALDKLGWLAGDAAELEFGLVEGDRLMTLFLPFSTSSSSG